MTKYFSNNFSIVNLYKKPSTKSEVVTQMIYGENFKINRKTKKWLKIKIKEDNYIGYIKKKKFKSTVFPTHKVSVLKSNIYKFPYKSKIIDKLTFGSKMKILEKKSKYFKFEKGWIEKKNIKPIKFKDKSVFKKTHIFKNVKYKWGGKSFKGIDCSGLVQIMLNFNNKICPRDAQDQNIFFKGKIKIKNIKKNNLIFWKGHVAIALSKKKLIHAYGPEKKTLVMNINKTLERIKKTAKLNVIGVRRV